MARVPAQEGQATHGEAPDEDRSGEGSLMGRCPQPWCWRPQAKGWCQYHLDRWGPVRPEFRWWERVRFRSPVYIARKLKG